MANMMLTLTRRGSFEVRAVKNSDATQCGIRGTRKFYFRAEIDCPSNAIDENGFIVDQFDVLRMFRARYRKVNNLPSCEHLALDACREIHKLAPYATDIRVTVGTGPKAYMTARLRSAS